MRDRFLAHELFEEWMEGRLTRTQWNDLVTESPGMREFRSVMFARLVPNLRAIGLMPPRMLARYERAGLMQYYEGATATELGGKEMLEELDRAPA